MNKKKTENHAKIREFVDELAGFAIIAEETLKKIETDFETNKNLFLLFSDRMFAIRGTTLQLGLPHIAHIAGIGEEIALKSISATTGGQKRRCIGSLWDGLTTLKYLLEHHEEETNEEQKILIHRLENTLRLLGGARPTATADEIDRLLQQRTPSR